MRRFFLVASAVVLAAANAPALRVAVIAPLPTAQKVVAADAVVVGKVTSVEKETVDLEAYPGGPKVAHTVAVLKVEDALVGAKNVTHIKVVSPKPGEQPQPGGPGGGAPARPILPPAPRGGFGPIAVTENQEGVFFLTKHPGSAGHYQINPGHNPLLTSDGAYKEELAKVKAASGVLSDPVKALAADKLDDRVQAALTLAYKYRAYPTNNPTGVVDEVPVPGEEGKLLLKVLLDADWVKTDAHKLADALGLLPGQYGIPDVLPAQGEDPNAARQKAFKAWHAKFGDKFQVTKVVAKTKSGK